jgi:subtilase family serine protease
LYLEPWIIDKNNTKFEKIFVAKMKTNKPQMNIRAMNEKATMYVVPNISISVVAIIQVQIDKNIIHDVLLNWGYKVNIVIKQLKARLR